MEEVKDTSKKERLKLELKKILAEMNVKQGIIDDKGLTTIIEDIIKEEELERLVKSNIIKENGRSLIQIFFYLDKARTNIELSVNKVGEIDFIRNSLEAYKNGSKMLKVSKSRINISDDNQLTNLTTVEYYTNRPEATYAKYKINGAYFYATDISEIIEDKYKEGLLNESQIGRIESKVLSEMVFPSFRNITGQYEIISVKRLNGYLAEVSLKDTKRKVKAKGIFNLDSKYPNSLYIQEANTAFPDASFFEEYAKAEKTFNILSEDEKQVFLRNATKATRKSLQEDMGKPINPDWIENPTEIEREDSSTNKGR